MMKMLKWRRGKCVCRVASGVEMTHFHQTLLSKGCNSQLSFSNFPFKSGAYLTSHQSLIPLRPTYTNGYSVGLRIPMFKIP